MIPLYTSLLNPGDIFSYGRESKRKLKSILSRTFDMKNVSLTSDGRNAIYLALMSMDLRKNDEIIIPGYTCNIVPNTLEKVCSPVYADINIKTYTIDPEKIEEKITKRTRALLIVHSYGNPCNMNKIMKIADRHNLMLIEDVAQALFGRYDNQLLGSFGDYSILSFRFSKDITCFKGGAVVTNKHMDEYIERENNILIKARILSLLLGLRVMRSGPSIQSLITETVKNTQFQLEKRTLSEYQCSLLNKQLKQIEEAIEKRRQNADFYNRNLDKTITPKEEKKGLHTYFRYPLRIENRDQLYKHMLSRGIQVDTMYNYSLCSECKNSVLLSNQIMNIPVHHKLKRKDLEKVVEAIHEFRQME